ncbi:hypothetical protein, partial [Dietzia sp.]|uniref:hypothetical protein n=1 Tax=Dietzia sp. TaxID=1871616 RepID=UPI002FDB0B6D
MNTAELLFATHLAASAWGGAPLDSGIEALSSPGVRAAVEAGPALSRAAARAADGAASPVDEIAPRGPWMRFVRELGAADGVAPGPGALFTAAAVLLRSFGEGAAESAGSEAAAAAEFLALAPATVGDLSALPAHRPLSEFVLAHGGAVLVRDPDSRMTAAVAHTLRDREGRWTVEIFADVPMAPQAPSPAHAAAALTDAVHGAAELIAAGSGPYARENGGVLPEPELIDLPASMSSRCLELVDRAETVERIRVAAIEAESRRGAPAQQQPALWALQSAVNLARRAAVARFAAEQYE